MGSYSGVLSASQANRAAFAKQGQHGRKQGNGGTRRAGGRRTAANYLEPPEGELGGSFSASLRSLTF